MRKLLALSVLALVAVPAAGASHRVGLTLQTSSSRVLFGKPVTLTGRLSGVQNARIEVLAWRFKASSPTVVATTVMRSSGRYSLKVAPSILTTYKVRVGSVLSQPVRVAVQPALSLRELGDGTIWAHASAGRSFAGRSVELQQLRGSSWQTIRNAQLKAGSTRIFEPLAGNQSGHLRLAMSVNEAGAGYLGSQSHSLAYHAFALTLEPQSFKVLYGHSTTIGGRLWNGKAGEQLVLQEWLFGRSAPVRLASVTTGSDGRWSFRVSPTVGTHYQVLWGTKYKSANVGVGVAPAITIERLKGDRIAVHVRAGRSFTGHQVKLQQQVSPGVWRPVQQIELGRGSNGVFHVVGVRTSMVRVAMSVNEAGAGYMASFSRAIRYQP